MSHPQDISADQPSPLTPLPDALANDLADRYRVERELGAGGMANRDHTVMRSAAAHALAVTGEHARARAILRDLEALAAQRDVSPYERGLVYLALGETETALARFAEARERHDGWLPYVNIDPRLRARPEFADVAAVLGRDRLLR